MIEVLDVRKIFHAGRPNEFTALDGVSLTVHPRRVTVLKGPSGSGKTTLLGILGCMARPTAGRVVLFGREVTSLPERFLTEVRRKTSGFIFQQFHLIRGVSCLENVMLPAYPTGAKYGPLRSRALHLLDLLDIAPKASAKVEWLSGGEAQRVAIARALINDPPVLIADEPTAHLDTRLSQDFLEVMGRLKRDGKTIVIASHDPLVSGAPFVDAVVEMRDGRVVDGSSR
ncbi:MAG: ABC transporter ATP-binding protein [Deltaproteobacteria bacterium]|nr:ABC transporter ATP-binding protein [Deltaproteobacteria bacterium]